LLLVPFRASDWLRRLFGSATEVAATTAASPAVATTAMSTGERVTAAAVAVLMATTVGVGAVAIRQASTDKADKPQAPVVAPSPSAPVTPAASPQPSEPKTKHQGHAKAAVAASADTEAVPVVSPTPPPSPSPTATGTPPPTVTPPPPPAPAWSAAFSWSMFGDDVALTQVNSKVESSVGENLLFSQTTTGSFADSDGTAYGLYIEYWGSAEGGAGTASTWVFVDTPEGRYRYDGSLSLTAATLAEDGTSTYVFSGSYTLADAPESTGDLVMPHDGAVTLVLHVWSDETSLYKARVSLVEAS
jgi:hypothetical protein